MRSLIERAWNTPNRAGIYDRIRCEVCDGTGTYHFPAFRGHDPFPVCCPAPQIEGYTQCGGRGYIVKEQDK